MSDGVSYVLSVQEIERLIERQLLTASQPFEKQQLQPASLDLRLGKKVFRIAASFLPSQGFDLSRRLQDLLLYEQNMEEDGLILEPGCVYLIPLMESCQLSANMAARANPKSSIGRLDVLVRLLTERALFFDEVVPGYQGNLYLEIAPRTFGIRVRPGDSLNQLRFFTSASLEEKSSSKELLEHNFTVCLSTKEKDGIVGWRARRHSGIIDLRQIGHYKIASYWDAVRVVDDIGGIILEPDQFYVLVTNEPIVIPPNHAAEMQAYDTKFGEFRVHYAGFFDPGFGYGHDKNNISYGVLEVRTHDVPFLVTHGQQVGKLVYHPMSEVPNLLYGGGGTQSHYQGQGLRLSKYFSALEMHTE